MTDDSFPREQHNDMVSNSRFGKITLHYEDGRVVRVTKEEIVMSPQTINRDRNRHKK